MVVDLMHCQVDFLLNQIEVILIYFNIPGFGLQLNYQPFLHGQGIYHLIILRFIVTAIVLNSMAFPSAALKIKISMRFTSNSIDKKIP